VSGASAGNTAALEAAGDAMRDLSNMLARLVEFGPVNTGGAVEKELLAPQCGGSDGGLGDQIERVARAVVSRMMSASQQTEDGALLLWASGKAFVRSDTPPDGAALHKVGHDAKTGVTYYTDNGGDGYYKRDASGQWAYGTDGYDQVGTVNRPLPKSHTEPRTSGAAPTAEPTTTEVLSELLGGL
jgi:hypothetical protein